MKSWPKLASFRNDSRQATRRSLTMRRAHSIRLTRVSTNGGRLPEFLLFPLSLRIHRTHVLYTHLSLSPLAHQAVSGPVLIGPRMRPSAASSSEVKTAADGRADDPSDRRTTGCERVFVISTRRWQVDCVRRWVRTRLPTPWPPLARVTHRRKRKREQIRGDALSPPCHFFPQRRRETKQ